MAETNAPLSIIPEYLPLKFKRPTKTAIYTTHVKRILNQTSRMFEYDGLPESIPSYELEKLLQTDGAAVICRPGDGALPQYGRDLYAVRPALFGLNPYYRPTSATLASPTLGSATMTIGVDCAVVYNDTYANGLLSIIDKHAWLLTENELTINRVLVNRRAPFILSAMTANERQAALDYLEKLDEGEAAVIRSALFGEDTQVHPTGQTSGQSLIDLIEIEQYILGSLYHKLGLQSSYNMKRESLTENEIGMDESTLYPTIDDMLACRRRGLDMLRDVFGVDVSVRRASSWADVEDDRGGLRTEPTTEPDPAKEPNQMGGDGDETTP